MQKGEVKLGEGCKRKCIKISRGHNKGLFSQLTLEPSAHQPRELPAVALTNRRPSSSAIPPQETRLLGDIQPAACPLTHSSPSAQCSQTIGGCGIGPVFDVSSVTWTDPFDLYPTQQDQFIDYKFGYHGIIKFL
ncbi:hypothetical protein MUG91_G263n33 [Manis pentadactyla]|nr:hypothetical protein MUG91_G263n33 [Manis pentadactyla]